MDRASPHTQDEVVNVHRKFPAPSYDTTAFLPPYSPMYMLPAPSTTGAHLMYPPEFALHKVEKLEGPTNGLTPVCCGLRPTCPHAGNAADEGVADGVGDGADSGIDVLVAEAELDAVADGVGDGASGFRLMTYGIEARYQVAGSVTVPCTSRAPSINVIVSPGYQLVVCDGSSLMPK